MAKLNRESVQPCGPEFKFWLPSTGSIDEARGFSPLINTGIFTYTVKNVRLRLQPRQKHSSMKVWHPLNQSPKVASSTSCEEWWGPKALNDELWRYFVPLLCNSFLWDKTFHLGGKFLKTQDSLKEDEMLRPSGKLLKIQDKQLESFRKFLKLTMFTMLLLPKVRWTVRTSERRP